MMGNCRIDNLSLLLLGALCTLSSSIYGQQVGKKQLTRGDYKMWHTLYGTQISDYGKWISYGLRYESGADTLFLQNTANKAIKAYPKSGNSKFASESAFACTTSDSALVLTNLKAGSIARLPGVITYEVVSNGRYLLSLESGGDIKNLCLRDVNGQLVQMIANVGEYKVNHKQNQVAFGYRTANRFAVGLMKLSGKSIITPIAGVEAAVSSLTWSDNNDYLAFYVNYTADSQKLAMYSEKLKALKVLSNLADTPLVDKSIYESADSPILVTNDGGMVFFGIRQTKFKVAQKGVVEIWNGNDKLHYRERTALESYNKPFLAVWHLKTGQVTQISSPEYSVAVVTGTHKYALTADLYQYTPQYQDRPDLDFYLTDLDDGNRTLVARKIYGSSENIGISPNGNYIHYYKDGDWWIYDIEHKTQTNLTQGLCEGWDNKEFDQGDELSVFGVARWSMHNDYILLYDRFDLWKISTDGRSRKKLTNGRPAPIRYRIVDLYKERSEKGNYFGSVTATCDLEKEIMLSVKNLSTGASGYSKLLPDGRLQKFIYEAAKITELHKAEKKDVYIYNREGYDDPPRVVLKSSSEEKTIMATNLQHHKFLWGKSEMIYYKDSKGRALRGALFYPAGYDQHKKYPMVVYIYQSLSVLVNQYNNPTDRSGYGFNLSSLTTNGYFVLMPDIYYEMGNPGQSAVDCVTSAVSKVIEGVQVDPSKVGLYGHSFGGYETDFIVTQTNIFAAAISGAGVSDIQRHYFTLSEGFRNPDAWRYENQQYRMGDSFYNIKDLYVKNSPIMNAEKIETPILVWSGAEDENVRTEQSIAFYIALRRLDKKFMMLIYPDEGHILVRNAATEDLHTRMLDWFGHYLKGLPCKWITEGTK